MPGRPVPSEPSPFAALERAFASLVAGPSPLALDGAEVPGLPNRLVPLDELRSRLLHPSTRYATRDAALDVLVRRARAERGAWIVGLAGVLLPGLRRAIAPLVDACPGKQADLEAEMLAGFLTGLDRVAAGRPRPAGWLTGWAFDAAKTLVRRELAERGRPGHRPVSAEPPRLYGHPDFVLWQAVAEGAICADDAELIGETRLGGMTLPEAAAAWGLTYDAVERRRHRAEGALVAWIRGDFVGNGEVPAGSKGAGRPRQGRRFRPVPGLRAQPSPPHQPKEVSCPPG
jgi:hypothetical protein